jgi:NTP pyrophosphatase (non-canonical NTP hydrolase)
MDLADLQATIARTYLERDRTRGTDATFRWLTEEIGELAKALRTGDRANLEHEFSDALAWLLSLANLTDVDLTMVMTRYTHGCPKCGSSPCTCPL